MKGADRAAAALAASAEKLAAAAKSLTETADRARDRDQEQELRPVVRRDRPTDSLGRQVPRPLGSIAFLQGIPGLAAQFKKDVPSSHLEGSVVRCPCGASTDVSRGITSCTGGCNRYFLQVSAGRVVVAGPYADDEPEAAAA